MRKPCDRCGKERSLTTIRVIAERGAGLPFQAAVCKQCFNEMFEGLQVRRATGSGFKLSSRMRILEVSEKAINWE